MPAADSSCKGDGWVFTPEQQQAEAVHCEDSCLRAERLQPVKQTQLAGLAESGRKKQASAVGREREEEGGNPQRLANCILPGLRYYVNPVLNFF